MQKEMWREVLIVQVTTPWSKKDTEKRREETGLQPHPKNYTDPKKQGQHQPKY